MYECSRQCTKMTCVRVKGHDIFQLLVAFAGNTITNRH